ncbi:MAG: hypothetical protein H0S85_07955 [Desulfovibrionaceae bacterium]|jgi:hypothetical protein|nr:hypothetical protein [Desulfovibrionaceae bacterium]
MLLLDTERRPVPASATVSGPVSVGAPGWAGNWKDDFNEILTRLDALCVRCGDAACVEAGTGDPADGDLHADDEASPWDEVAAVLRDLNGFLDRTWPATA